MKVFFHNYEILANDIFLNLSIVCRIIEIIYLKSIIKRGNILLSIFYFIVILGYILSYWILISKLIDKLSKTSNDVILNIILLF